MAATDPRAVYAPFEPSPHRRPFACPGCCGRLIRQRRARPGRWHVECLQARVREMDAAKGIW